MNPDLAARLAYAGLAYPILLFSLTFHEWGHARSAKFFGDRTAEQMGRLTMNPIPHIDPIGTLLAPLLILLTGFPFLFGWANPVPVNSLLLRRLSDIVWVSLAGPACNLILAVAGVVAFKAYLLADHPYAGELAWQLGAGDVVQNFLALWIAINVLLAIFNLLPVPPLDGSKVVLAQVPGHSRTMPFWIAYERSGLFILAVLFVSGAFDYVVGIPLSWILTQIHHLLA